VHVPYHRYLQSVAAITARPARTVMRANGILLRVKPFAPIRNYCEMRATSLSH
jgi:hypothetical protein